MGKHLVISQPTQASSSRSRYAAGEPTFVQDDATTGTGGYKETASGASPAVSGAYVSGFYARWGPISNFISLCSIPKLVVVY